MMQLFLILGLGVLVVFITDCALATIAGALGLIALRKLDFRQSVPLLLSSVLLVTALCFVPHLNYYIGYGIRSQALRSERIIFCSSLGGLFAGLATRGWKKWIPIIPALTLLLPFLFMAG